MSKLEINLNYNPVMRLYVFLIFSIMRRTDNRVFYDTKIAKKYASRI